MLSRKCKLKLQCDTTIYPPERLTWNRLYIDLVSSDFGKLLINSKESFSISF